jgi:pimeloyl-ACP methyl ester carboxylesterase
LRDIGKGAVAYSPHMQVYRRRVHLESLEGNPLRMSPERDVVIFVPDVGKDHARHDGRFPTVYFLHGYGASLDPPTIGSNADLRKNPLRIRLLLALFFRKLVTFERLEAAMHAGAMPPFMLVQPDGSLPMRQNHGRRNPDGTSMWKGSLYADSPYTGRHGSAIFRDLVSYVDAEFPTLPNRAYRALVGGSMGGYGALVGGILHPETFGHIAALSPAVCCLDVIEHRMVVPLRRLLAGTAAAAQEGRELIEDILDSCDMVYSRDKPLLPTLRKDEHGTTIDYDPVAWDRWAQWDVSRLIRERPDALARTQVLINCHEGDEYGFAEPGRRVHRALTATGITHHFEIYNDLLSAITSPHIVGIGRHLAPALQWAAHGMAQ